MRTVIGKKDIEYSPETGLSSPVLRGGQPKVRPDNYKQRLFKYIPAEVVVAYLALDTLIRPTGENHLALYWLVFAFGVIATPLYLGRILHVHKLLQLAISTVAFAVWVFAIGGPFVYLDFYEPIYGGVLLVIYTFFIPIIEA